jgi:hypothetical protein
MNTTAYTDNAIFQNNQINAIIDLLFLKITEQFPAVNPDVANDAVFQHIILSGNAALIIQNPKIESLKNIIFQCDNQVIYDWIALNYQNIFNCSGMIFRERIIFYPFGFYFEIWFSSINLNPIVAQNITIQHIDSIPAILK